VKPGYHVSHCPNFWGPLYQPCFAAEVFVLLGAQLVGQSVGGKFYIVIRDNFVFLDFLCEDRVLDEPLRQIIPLVRIYIHSVVSG
jgi:hypothetical protein